MYIGLNSYTVSAQRDKFIKANIVVVGVSTVAVEQKRFDSIQYDSRIKMNL